MAAEHAAATRYVAASIQKQVIVPAGVVIRLRYVSHDVRNKCVHVHTHIANLPQHIDMRASMLARESWRVQKIHGP